ncbi:MAG: DUF262 domain-containing protein [Tannerellaceae bacterium]|jgi:hypothetical protein|nr:DUF262 domain-containing protein [Tannerellaceae bacterium]
MEVEVKIDGKVTLLTFQKDTDINIEDGYCLVDDFGCCLLKIVLRGRKFEIIEKNNTLSDTEEELEAKLDQLVLSVIEQEQLGTDNTEHKDTGRENPYNPDDIKVSAKQFSIKLIKEMVDSEDIVLSPDFQRHLVWDNRQRSRLIESILLRIPLPMFYFSEDKDGKLSVVDGLQRITAISDFMDDKFPLKGLEYLEKSCEGKRYTTLEPKYARWFKLTQISGNVIDPSSPYGVKYDIFRRINTGGKPLNNQEIRNCLAGEALRDILNKMVKLEEFKRATDKSIKSTRMEDSEMALRFILFRDLMTSEGNINRYDSYMDASLDALTERLRKSTINDLEHHVEAFSRAMYNAEYLFESKYAFRKVRTKDLKRDASKQLINKALFVSWSVLLADYDPERVKRKNKRGVLKNPIAKMIEEDSELWTYLSYGTNGKSNLLCAFSRAEKLIKAQLNY